MSLQSAERRDFIRDMISDDLASGKHQAPVTRFPPEPNGYLHIGHAKSICLNFGIAQEFPGARCHLRFDDTNPSKEDQEYVDSIQEDIHWLGFGWGDNLFFASDMFDFFYECAVSLINQGLAYVDEQTVEEIRAQRGNVNVPGQESPYRNRSAEENLKRFQAMKNGEIPEGKAILRAKIDMASSNMNMRDPVLYRIMFAEHHNTGNKWCIYPMYDFAHPLEDAYEHITHSLCTLEFENHRPLYDWVIEHCPVPSRPRQTEFARLNLTYTVMSKRKLLQLVQEGHVTGWDDPRMPTVSGMRRRGYTPAAIRNFCQTIGITKFNGFTDVALLEYSVREDLNANAPRRMAVLNPLKLTITTLPEDAEEMVEVQNNPENRRKASARCRSPGKSGLNGTTSCWTLPKILPPGPRPPRCVCAAATASPAPTTGRTQTATSRKSSASTFRALSAPTLRKASSAAPPSTGSAPATPWTGKSASTTACSRRKTRTRRKTDSSPS